MHTVQEALRPLLAAHPDRPERSSSAGVIAAARAVIAADRAQTLTSEHVNALDNAIKIQRDELTLLEPHAEVTDAIAAVKTVLEANAVYFGRDKLQQIVDAARTGASSC